LNNRQILPNRNCSTLAIPWCFYKISRAFDGFSTSIIWQKDHPPQLKHRPIFLLLFQWIPRSHGSRPPGFFDRFGFCCEETPWPTRREVHDMLSDTYHSTWAINQFFLVHFQRQQHLSTWLYCKSYLFDILYVSFKNSESTKWFHVCAKSGLFRINLST